MATSESGRRKSWRCFRIVASTPTATAAYMPAAEAERVVRIGLDEEAVPALELRLDAAAERAHALHRVAVKSACSVAALVMGGAPALGCRPALAGVAGNQSR